MLRTRLFDRLSAVTLAVLGAACSDGGSLPATETPPAGFPTPGAAPRVDAVLPSRLTVESDSAVLFGARFCDAPEVAVGGLPATVRAATPDTVLLGVPAAADLTALTMQDLTVTCPGGATTVEKALERDPALATLPELVEYAPQGTVTGLRPQLRLAFNRSLDEASLAGTIGIEGVSGVVAYDSAAFIVTFTPDADLVAGQTYTGFVLGGSSGVRSPLGSGLAKDLRWLVTPVPEAVP
jgi:hypothetical protein